MKAREVNTVDQSPAGVVGEQARPRGVVHVLRTSTRTGFVFLRFSVTALLSAGIDNVLFYAVFRATGNIALSQVSARIVSLLFNYRALRLAVFLSDQRHHVLLSRYLPLAAVNTSISYVCIRLLSAATPLSVVSSKIVAETALFVANFVVQRAFIFAHRPLGHRVS
jgi:putative flippase GtrA